MVKGEETRSAILERAVAIATVDGLDGVSIGRLAEDLRMSKSGIFAHFRSKEALNVAIIEAAEAAFVDAVVRPALTAPRGLPRLRALFEHWLQYALQAQPGGCFFMAAAFELDDRDGPERDRLVRSQTTFQGTLARAVEIAIAEGHLSDRTPPAVLAFQIYAVMMGMHHAARLLRDPRAADFARATFALVIDAHLPPV